MKENFHLKVVIAVLIVSNCLTAYNMIGSRWCDHSNDKTERYEELFSRFKQVRKNSYDFAERVRIIRGQFETVNSKLINSRNTVKSLEEKAESLREVWKSAQKLVIVQRKKLELLAEPDQEISYFTT